MYIFVYMYIYSITAHSGPHPFSPDGRPLKCVIPSFAFGFSAHCLSGRLLIEQSDIFNSICINCRRCFMFFADVYGFHVVDGSREGGNQTVYNLTCTFIYYIYIIYIYTIPICILVPIFYFFEYILFSLCLPINLLINPFIILFLLTENLPKD